MENEQLNDGGRILEETEDGFKAPDQSEEASIDSEIDFDDESYLNDESCMDGELMSEEEAGNAEGDSDGHLDVPAEVAEDDHP